jgi:hypothetical protein
LLTTTAVTIVPAAYAGGDDHDDDNGDGNKNKAEEESAAAIADCDENEVEQAGFDCIAIASDVETAEEPPEESATLFVCKEVENPPTPLIPSDFEFIITGPDIAPGGIQVPGGPIGDPDPDCPPGSNQPGGVVPGEYVILETDSSVIPDPNTVQVEGDCTQIDPPNEAFEAAATVEIQEGETGTLTCTFTNIYIVG